MISLKCVFVPCFGPSFHVRLEVWPMDYRECMPFMSGSLYTYMYMFILLHVTNLLGFVSLLNIYSCLLSTYWVVLNFTLFTASSNLRITKMSNSCFYYKNNLNMYYKVQFKFWVFFLLEILIDPLKRLKNLLHLITIDILGPLIIYYLFIYWFSST